ncbi:hypothetical protein L7F22_028579 [Adiantum nelumboides]|nr:hypothetical protein [Adiantum nelumboides]
MAASGVTHITSSAVLQNSLHVPMSIPHSASSQDSSVLADSSMVQDFKPIGSGVAPSLRSGPGGTGNVSLLPNSSQARPILGTSVGNSLVGVPGGSVPAGGLPMPGMLSSSSASGGVSTSQTLHAVAQNGLGLTNNQVGIGMGQGVGMGGFSNTGNLVGNASLGAVPSGGPGNNSVSNMQAVGMGQSIAGLGQGNLSAATTQIGPTGLVMGGQNVLPALGSVGVNPSPPNMIPTPGIAQPVQGLQPMGAVNSNALHTMGAVNNNALQVPAPVATPPQQPNAGQKYAKIWEGYLTGHRQGKPVSICKLEAYRQASSPETLAADWPNQMQIVRLITQDHMHSKNYQGKSEVLIFRTVGQHGQQGFLVQLAEKKLCAVIQLPTQTLLLASTDVKKQDRMLGMLFPGDMVVFKPQPSSQQQQQQQQQLQQPALSTVSTITQAFSSQGQLPNQVRPQLLQPGQLPSQGPGAGFMQ